MVCFLFLRPRPPFPVLSNENGLCQAACHLPSGFPWAPMCSSPSVPGGQGCRGIESGPWLPPCPLPLLPDARLCLQGWVLEAGPRPLELGSEASTSVMRLKLEVEEKKQAMLLLQRALVTLRALLILGPPSLLPAEAGPTGPSVSLLCPHPAGAAARPHGPAGQGDREGIEPAATAAEGALRGHHPAALGLHRPGERPGDRRGPDPARGSWRLPESGASLCR